LFISIEIILCRCILLVPTLSHAVDISFKTAQKSVQLPNDLETTIEGVYVLVRMYIVCIVHEYDIVLSTVPYSSNALVTKWTLFLHGNVIYACLR